MPPKKQFKIKPAHPTPEQLAADHWDAANMAPLRSILAVVFLVALGAISYFGVTAYRRAQAEQTRLEATRSQVERIAQVEFESLSQSEAPITHEVDAWGRPIVVEKSKGAWDSARATSLGPDGKPSLADDISATRTSAIDAKKAGRVVGVQLGRFSRGALQGLGQAVKEAREDRNRAGQTAP